MDINNIKEIVALIKDTASPVVTQTIKYLYFDCVMGLVIGLASLLTGVWILKKAVVFSRDKTGNNDYTVILDSETKSVLLFVIGGFVCLIGLVFTIGTIDQLGALILAPDATAIRYLFAHRG